MPEPVPPWESAVTSLWFQAALLPTGWADSVRVTLENGLIAGVDVGAAELPADRRAVPADPVARARLVDCLRRIRRGVRDDGVVERETRRLARSSGDEWERCSSAGAIAARLGRAGGVRIDAQGVALVKDIVAKNSERELKNQKPLENWNDTDVAAIVRLVHDAGGKVVFYPMPLHSAQDGRCSCGRDCDSPAKHPRTENGLKDATDDVDSIQSWFARWPDANVAIATGHGLLVVDLDDAQAIKTLERLADSYGGLPDCPVVQTGRGRHLYFATDQELRNRHE